MATLSIPMTDSAFYSDRLLYFRMRRQGKKSLMSPFTSFVPLASGYEDSIPAPKILSPSVGTVVYPVNVFFSREYERKLTFKLSPFVADNPEETLYGIEYEAYRNIYSNNETMKTELIPVSSLDSPDAFVIPENFYMQNVYDTVYAKCWIRARYVTLWGNTSGWSRLIMVYALRISDATTPVILSDLSGNVELKSAIQFRPSELMGHEGTKVTSDMLSPYILNMQVFGSATGPNTPIKTITDLEFVQDENDPSLGKFLMPSADLNTIRSKTNEYPFSYKIRCCYFGCDSPYSELFTVNSYADWY